MTLVKVKVTIECHKGQILGQNLDLNYFQHLQLLEYSVIGMESHLIGVLEYVFLIILIPCLVI